MNNALMEIGRKLVISLSIDEREKHEALGIILSALEEAAQHRVQADLLPCGHSSDNLGNFGGCNPMGSCVICDAATSR